MKRDTSLAGANEKIPGLYNFLPHPPPLPCHRWAKCENEESKLAVAMSSRMHETANCRAARRNESVGVEYARVLSATGAIPEGKFHCIGLTTNRLTSEASDVHRTRGIDVFSRKGFDRGEEDGRKNRWISPDSGPPLRKHQSCEKDC